MTPRKRIKPNQGKNWMMATINGVNNPHTAPNKIEDKTDEVKSKE